MRLSAGSKGKGPVTAVYAKGGDPLQAGSSRFLKQPNIFTAPFGTEKRDYGAKKDPLADAEGDTKKQKAIKPRT